MGRPRTEQPAPLSRDDVSGSVRPGKRGCPEEERKESVRRQPRGGAKRRRHGGAKRRRHEVATRGGKRARRHAIRRARRQEAARRGRRAARTREEVKYRKEGRQKRAERTGGRGRRCTEAEHECGWRGRRGGVQKKSGGRVESSTAHLSVLHQPTGRLETGCQVGDRRPGAKCRGPEAGCRNRGSGTRVGTKTAASAMRRGDA